MQITVQRKRTSRFMVGDCLLRFVPPKSFSLSSRQTGIGAFLAHFPSPSASTQVFFGLCRARRMLVSEPFNPTFFGRAGINSEPNRAAHRRSKRL
jgi:hypothetical protein